MVIKSHFECFQGCKKITQVKQSRVFYNRYAIMIPMTLKDDIKAYRTRWAEVDAVIAEERRTASLELRWQQLNAAYAFFLGIGIHQEDLSEIGVFERWAKLKEQATDQPP